MTNVILAVLEQAETAGAVLAAARQLAGLAGAGRINVLAIRLPPLDAIVTGEELQTRGQAARLREREMLRTAPIAAVFDAWRQAPAPDGLVTEWLDVEGHADDVIRDHGSRADCIVLSRPSAQETEAERQMVHAALFDTDRPVLMVPSDWHPAPFGRHVAIAWRDDPRTLKAVLAALRWLGRSARIDVLVGLHEPEAVPSLPAVFAEHGIDAVLHAMPVNSQSSFGADLLAQARAQGADLIVLGAFARHPLRSLILGGVTRVMLAEADLPVFMRH